jgi:hypothetical protein
VIVLLTTLLAIPIGLALDYWIARLSREPYEREEVEENDLRLKRGEAAAVVSPPDPLRFKMPRALTTARSPRCSTARSHSTC